MNKIGITIWGVRSKMKIGIKKNDNINAKTSYGNIKC